MLWDSSFNDMKKIDFDVEFFVTLDKFKVK